MKRSWAVFCSIAAALLLSGISASALSQFSGYFSGYYAPANWTKVVSNNPLYQNTAFINAGNAPQSLEIDGAVDALQQTSTPQLPPSIVDYTIVLGGSGLQPVAFGYLFNGAADAYDSAQLIYKDGSGVQVAAILSSVIGSQQTFAGSLQGGWTFGFRVYSNNDNLADSLVISAIPEPSALAFLGLGAGALLFKLRRRLS